MWTRRLKKTKIDRQRRIFFFFRPKRERQSSRNRLRNDGIFLGGNVDEKAQENEDETIKSKKERLEGVLRAIECMQHFFLSCIK